MHPNQRLFWPNLDWNQILGSWFSRLRDNVCAADVQAYAAGWGHPRYKTIEMTSRGPTYVNSLSLRLCDEWDKNVQLPNLLASIRSFATAPGFLWTLSFHGNFLNPRGFTLEPKTLSSVHYGKPMVPWEKPTGHRASRLGVKKRTRSRRWPSFWLCDSRFHSFLLEKEEISNNI